MLALESMAGLRGFADDRGMVPEQLDAITAVNLMADWYDAVRVDDVALDDDGDMLLFEWGTYPWGGLTFRYMITRQFILANSDDDDASFWQLSLIMHFASDEATAALASGTRWCHRPEGLDEFRSFIESAEATSYAISQPPTRTDVRLEASG